MMKRLILAVVAVFLLSTSVSFAQVPNKAFLASAQELILQLEARIKELQLELQKIKLKEIELSNELTLVTAKLTFTKNLQRGMRGDEVSALQEFLKSLPGIYPEGLVTGYFGELTEKAVKRWQAENGIESIGIVGPKTRLQINFYISNTTASSTPTTTTSTSTPVVTATTTPTTTATTTTPSTTATSTTPTTATSTDTGSSGEGTTTPPPTTTTADTTAPTISSLQSASVTSEGARITWTTNESANGRVYLSPGSATFSSSTALNSSLSTSHLFDLSGLTAETTYYYRVTSADAAGNTTTSDSATFITSTVSSTSTPDTTAPVISSVTSASITAEAATVTWNTNESATGKVIFSANSATYSSSTALVSSLSTGHTFNMSGLESSTLYYYKVVSADSSSNSATSDSYTFTTATASAATSTPDTTGPVISGVSSGSVTHEATTITWSTDEAATGQVYLSPNSESFSSSTAKVSSLSTSHSFSLSGLESSTLYYYRVVSEDSLANTTTSGSYSFTTGTAPAATSSTPAVTQGSTLWLREFGGTGSDSAYGVGVDGLGNLYVVGDTGSSLDGTNAGSDDAFIAKYDDDGNSIWTKQFGSAYGDYLKGVAADSSGNVYAVGLTYGSIDGQSNSGNTDALVVKYDSNGNKIWTREFGSSLNDQLYEVALDSSGNIYASGHTDTSLDGQSHSGNTDALLVKYDSSGNRVWTRLLGTSNYDKAEGLTVDGSGNVYIAGWVRAALAGQSAFGGDDGFIAKYDSSGNLLWSKQEGTSSTDYMYGIGTDSSGNIYTSGYTNGAMGGQTNSGGFDAFVSKHDGNGNLQWTSQFGGSSDEYEVKIANDSSGNTYVGGYTNSSAIASALSAGGQDAFIAKYNNQGVQQWVNLRGTSSSDTGRKTAVSGTGAYLVGRTGSGDVFIAKYSP